MPLPAQLEAEFLADLQRSRELDQSVEVLS